MSDSVSEAPFSTKTTDLKARLQQMQTQHESRMQQIENDAFESFELDLKNLLRAEATTLANAYKKQNRVLNAQKRRLRKEVLRQTAYLVWMARIPVLASGMICLVIICMALLWFRLQGQERIRTSNWTQDGKSYRIVDDPTWTFCQLGHIEKDSTAKTDTHILTPCKLKE